MPRNDDGAALCTSSGARETVIRFTQQKGNTAMRFAFRILCVAAVVIATVGVASAAIINFTATLNGAQEVPPTGSPATGSGTLVMDTVANTLSYTITFSGLLAPQTAGHIHGFAAPGVATGILHGFAALGSPTIGVWNFTEAQEANIIAGLTYANIHTSQFSAGEIRGQIVVDNSVGVEPRTFSAVKSLYSR